MLKFLLEKKKRKKYIKKWLIMGREVERLSVEASFTWVVLPQAK